MIMQYVWDSCIDSKIKSSLLRFIKYKASFIEPEWKFFNDKLHEVSSFYGLPKVRKYMVIKSAINTKNIEIIELFETNDHKLRPIVDRPKYSTRKLCQLIDIQLKLFLKYIKIFICNSLDLFNKCPRDLDEDTEIVTI